MRDRLIHDYIGVNYSIVWDVFKNKIPSLSVQIQRVLNEEQHYTQAAICLHAFHLNNSTG